MAITGHFIRFDAATQELHMEARLIAFRHVTSSHAGADLAKVFFSIVKELGILHKVRLYTCPYDLYLCVRYFIQLGTITMDNASNNDTFMVELEALLRGAGISFHRDHNRIR